MSELDRSLRSMFLYATTIFVSAFLLFLLQPIIAKQILPWFGGSAAVWTTCLVFFNCALLAGYFYSDWTTRKLKPKHQTTLHIALLCIALLLLPITPDSSWKPQGDESPSLRILLLLAATIGLPYFLLSTTSPLIQAWFARSHPGASPYRLFALSNLASMLALIGYPFLFEPWIATRTQSLYWSIGFGLFVLLTAVTAWRNRADVAQTIASIKSHTITSPTFTEKIIWLSLAALGTILLLAITNHLTQDISSIPLLWVVPLALYLLTFILCFDSSPGSKGWYRRWLFVPLLIIALSGMAYLLADRDYQFKLYLQIGCFCAGLFIACMFCHGELVRRKPTPQHLTTFYLMISVGGALGSLLVGVLAPMLLPAYFEMQIALVLLAALATVLLWGAWHRAVNVLAVLITLAVAGAAGYSIHDFNAGTLLMTRNFYGTLRVKEVGPPDEQYRRHTLIHGAILHGDQYLDAPYNRTPTTYYTVTSGIGLTILQKQKDANAIKIGVVGLGTGTIAAYARAGDTIRYYDINPRVYRVATEQFSYLNDAKKVGAQVEFALGDARLSMEREASQQFDVLAIDAFSGDSIPVHLITGEAVGIYLTHMKADGIIAYHVSNRFLDLKPVVKMIADAHHLHYAWLHESSDEASTTSDWIILTRDKAFLDNTEIKANTEEIPDKPTWALWTDDFNNLVQVLK